MTAVMNAIHQLYFNRSPNARRKGKKQPRPSRPRIPVVLPDDRPTGFTVRCWLMSTVEMTMMMKKLMRVSNGRGDESV